MMLLMYAVLCIFACANVRSSDDHSTRNKERSYALAASLPQRDIGALNLNEAIDRISTDSTLAESQLAAVEKSLQQMLQRKASLQMRVQDNLETLQRYRKMQTEREEETRTRELQKFVIVTVEEQAPSVHVNEAPKKMEEAAKPTDATPAPSSSWSLWKLLPFTS